MANFQHYSKYYDLLYKDKNYKAESQYVIKKMKQFAPSATQMVELGSGSGSHAHYFCEAGFKVTGIERSPDMIAVEKDEQRILSTYAPKKADDLKTYALEDAQELIEKIYKKKGMKATVERKEGNVFEIVGVRPLNDTVEYEDDLHDAQWSQNPAVASGEAEIEVPAIATETAAARDPYYEPTTSTRSDRSEYMKWTPGLERSFAPTYPTKDWIHRDT